MVHALDLAVLSFIIVNDAREIANLSCLALKRYSPSPLTAAMTASRLSRTMSFCDLPLPALGRCALRTALPTAALISSKNWLRSGSLPSLVIGMNGVVMLSRMPNCASLGAWATMWRSPQPNMLMLRLSREA
jgi:hypothetical protein